MNKYAFASDWRCFRTINRIYGQKLSHVGMVAGKWSNLFISSFLLSFFLVTSLFSLSLSSIPPSGRAWLTRCNVRSTFVQDNKDGIVVTQWSRHSICSQLLMAWWQVWVDNQDDMVREARVNWNSKWLAWSSSSQQERGEVGGEQRSRREGNQTLSRARRRSRIKG